jgi:N-acetylglucosamine-6-sulfatase
MSRDGTSSTAERGSVKYLYGVSKMLLLIFLLIAASMPATAQVSQRPNILYLFTDDNSERVFWHTMDAVQTRIGGEGVTFENATFAQSLCCPNRASMQRGQYPHNTRVLRNEPPEGGYATFQDRDLHLDTLAATIDAQGYRTGYFGKYMNGYDNFLSSVPRGWDTWFSGYPMGRCFSANGIRQCGEDYKVQMHDAWVNQQALPWIRDAAAEDAPFMATLSYYTPHAPCEHPDTYDTLYADSLPKPPPSFDEADVSDKPQWVRNNSRLTPERQAEIRQFYRCQLRSAAWVDDLIATVLDSLEATGEAENTYVVFWNDNGFKAGEHRVREKNSPYVEDTRFPLMVRGPGIPAGVSSKALVNSVDLRPTFEDMADARTPAYVDGLSWLPLAQGKSVVWRRITYSEGLRPPDTGDRTPFRATYSERFAYHRYVSGEEEFYDLERDPYELDGTLGTGEKAEAAAHKAALAEYRRCSGASCRGAGF